MTGDISRGFLIHEMNESEKHYIIDCLCVGVPMYLNKLKSPRSPALEIPD